MDNASCFFSSLEANLFSASYISGLCFGVFSDVSGCITGESRAPFLGKLGRDAKKGKVSESTFFP